MKKLLIMILVLTLAMSSMVFAEDATTTTETETTTEAAPVVPADGTYTIGVTSSSTMFKVIKAVLTSSNGTMSAVITLSGDGYPKLYMGTKDEAAANDSASIGYVPDNDGKYTFTIPVSALDTPINVAAYSTKNSIWYDRTLTFDSSTLIPTDGTYTIGVTSSSTMFKVIDAVLTSSNGTMSAVITLSGDGYPKLYMGTKDEAAANDSASIGYVPDSNGKYTFTIPVSALDTPINVAAYSTKNAIWYDRTLTFNSNTLVKISSEGPETNNDFIKVTTDANGVKTASIDASSDTVVTIPASSFSTISGGILSISTALGIVTFDADAIAGFTSKATGDVTLTVQNVSSNAAYKDSGYDMVISLTLLDAAGNAVFAEDSSGKATITVPYTNTVASGKTVKVYYVTASGKEPVDAVYNAANHTVTFTVAHFSDYAIVQEAAAPVTGDRNVAAMVIFFLIISGAVILRFTYTKKESL